MHIFPARLRALLLSSVVLALAGCAAGTQLGPRPGMSYPLAAQAAVEVRVHRDEIGVQVPVSNPGVYGGGLIGALVAVAVDSSRANKAEERVARMRDLLAGQDYREASLAAVQAGLRYDLLAPVHSTVMIAESEQQSRTAERLQPSQGLFLIAHDYYFLHDFSVLRVHLHARLADREMKKGKLDLGEIRYMNTLYYDFLLPGAPDKLKPEERAGLWLQQGAEALDAMVREGLAGTVEMLNHELAGAPGEVRGERAQVQLTDMQAIPRAHVVKTHGNREWVRVDARRILASVPRT